MYARARAALNLCARGVGVGTAVTARVAWCVWRRVAVRVSAMTEHRAQRRYTESTQSPSLHNRLLTLRPAPTDPVGQSWPRVTGSVGDSLDGGPALSPESSPPPDNSSKAKTSRTDRHKDLKDRQTQRPQGQTDSADLKDRVEVARGPFVLEPAVRAWAHGLHLSVAYSLLLGRVAAKHALEWPCLPSARAPAVCPAT